MPQNHNHDKQDALTAFVAERLSTNSAERHPSEVREAERQDALRAAASKAKQWNEWNALPHQPAETLAGSSLRILREACGLTTAELAAQVGADARTVEAFENATNVDSDPFLPAFKRVAGSMRDALLEAS